MYQIALKETHQEQHEAFDGDSARPAPLEIENHEMHWRDKPAFRLLHGVKTAGFVAAGLVVACVSPYAGVGLGLTVGIKMGLGAQNRPPKRNARPALNGSVPKG